MDKKGKHIDKEYLSQEDYENYLKGTLSNAGRHRVEKMLLESEFENEAMEGFSGMGVQDMGEDLGDLRRRLHRTTGRKNTKVVWIGRIAASIVLLALFSFGLYYLMERPEKKELISLNAAEQPDKTMKNESGMPSSVKGETGEAGAGISENEAIAKKDRPVSGTVEDSKIKTLQAVEGKQATARVNIDHEDAMATEADGEEDQIFDRRDEGMVTEYEEETMAVSQSADEPMAKSADEVSGLPEMAETSVGNANQRKGARISPSTKLSEADHSGGTGEIIAGNNKNTPVPVGGERAFREYLKKYIQYPPDEVKEGKNGTVVLAFTVTTSGEIKYLHIKKNLGDAFDKEAVRLVLEGPGWLPAVENGVPVEREVQIRIRFNPPDGGVKKPH